MYKINVLFLSAILLILVGCSKEEFNGPEANFKIWIENPNYVKTDPNSATLIEYEPGMTVLPGDKVTFENNSVADYISIWTGDEGHNYNNFGIDEGVNVSNELYEYQYSSPGSYNVTWITTSAINKSATVKREILESNIEITDNTAILNYYHIDIPESIVETEGNNIVITVPFGTDINNLIPEFDAGFATVTIEGEVQESGVSVVEFLDGVPVIYSLTSYDGSNSNEYTVTVNVIPGNSENWLTDFGFGAMPIDVIIDGNNFNITVPSEVDVTSLKATFNSPELATVTVNGVEQKNGRTPNDYTNPVTFIVTAQDGSVAEYVITVVKAG